MWDYLQIDIHKIYIYLYILDISYYKAYKHLGKPPRPSVAMFHYREVK